MPQIYVILGSRPNDVAEFVDSLASHIESPHKPVFISSEGLIVRDFQKVSPSPYPGPSESISFVDFKEEYAFFYIDPRMDLIPELDRLRDALLEAHISPNRIITVVDCELSEHSRKLRDYNEACIYHSDIVLLGNRDNVAKKWIQDYQKEFHKKAYPAHFTFLKKEGKVDDPKYLLFPETLRMTQLFDIEEGDSDLPVEIEASFDIHGTEEDSTDPYRHSDSEDFPLKRVPNIADLVVN